MRSIWKGHIRFSLVTIPIQIFNAVETKNNISFNQLHKEDNGRISYHKVCRTCEKKVSSRDIVKGFEYDKDQYVVFESGEFDALKLKSTRAIDIEAFVDIDEVHPSRFEAVYYVGPSSEVAQQTFSLFTQVLKKTGKAGVGRIILRDKEDVVLLNAKDNGLIMYKLRFPYEIRDMKKVPDLAEEVEVDEKQLNLAMTLVDSLSTTFDKVDFKDRYRDALMELVEKKIDGKQPTTPSLSKCKKMASSVIPKEEVHINTTAVKTQKISEKPKKIEQSSTPSLPKVKKVSDLSQKDNVKKPAQSQKISVKPNDMENNQLTDTSSLSKVEKMVSKEEKNIITKPENIPEIPQKDVKHKQPILTLPSVKKDDPIDDNSVQAREIPEIP